MMSIVHIQVWSIDVIYSPKQQSEAIDDEKQELDGESVSRPGNTEHGSWLC
jgi:hypothetical protein